MDPLDQLGDALMKYKDRIAVVVEDGDGGASRAVFAVSRVTYSGADKNQESGLIVTVAPVINPNLTK